MSDISINLDGLLAFIVASALGSILVLGIVIGSLVGLLKARHRRERFIDQRFFPQVVGMLASLLGCVVVVVLLLLTDTMPPPRGLNIWLDHWLWAWVIAVLALWPVTAFVWKKLRSASLVSNGEA